MEQWIRATFLCIPGGWDNGDGTRSDAFQFTREDDEGRIIPINASISRFVEHFGGVAVPPSATALKAVDPEDKMGWHAHFDEWVRQGIIQP